jgi:acetyl esterase
MKPVSYSLRALLATSILFTAACSMHHEPEAAAAPKPDADMQRVLDAQASLGPKPIEMLSAQDARLQPSPADGVKKLLSEDGKDPMDDMGVATHDIQIATKHGTLQARVYRPKEAGPHEHLPVVVYYHGGGWVIADIATYDSTPRVIAHEAHALVISVEYRHAPEHRFPAAHEDAFAAYQWVVRHAKHLGGDRKRIAVMGESAGANLAIDTAIRARDTHTPMPVYEVLVYPVAGVDMNTPSYRENENAKPLNKAMMKWFVGNTARSDGDLQDPRLDLVGHADLRGLPPTTVITAQLDPLRSEGQALAEKLRQSGVTVDAKNYDGVTHEFFGMGAVVVKAKLAETQVIDDLDAAFDTDAK